MTLAEAVDYANTKADAYADPGYQSDGKKRYALDTETQVRAAWSYINQKDNASKYASDQVSKIKARIMAAGKRFGIKFSEAAQPMTGRDIREAVRAITTEDALSLDESDLLLGRLVACEVEVREQEATGDMTATSDEHAPGRPANITDHLLRAHKLPESKLPDGATARYAMHDDLPHKTTESEHITGDVVALRERAVATDGVATIKLISPGWGSSGFYDRKVLERDIPKAFPVGTKMHWDHPTLSEERERPEGSLKTLAAELVSVPRWQEGPDGPGMYGDAKVFENFRKPVEELAPHIGVSIRADGRGREGEVDGRRGRVVEEIARGHSVDFVTRPGRGGKIVQLFESYRQGGEMAEETTQQTGGTTTTTETTDGTKPDETGTTTSTTETTTSTEATESDRERRRDERAALREARTIVRELLGDRRDVPEPTAKRLQESLPLRFKLTSDGDLDEAAFTKVANDAIDEEMRYIAEASGAGRVRGMNSVPEGEMKPEDEKALREGLRENLVALGSSKEQAALAIRE